MNKKIKLILPAVSVIVLITLISFFVCTFLAKENKVKEFIQETSKHIQFVTDNLRLNETPEGGDGQKALYKWNMAQLSDCYIDEWEKIEKDYNYSIVLYDYDTNTVETGDTRLYVMGADDIETVHLSDYLDKDTILGLSEDLKKCMYPDKGTIYIPKLWIDEEGNPVSLDFMERAVNNNDSWKSGNNNSTTYPSAQIASSRPPVKSVVLDEEKAAVSYELASCFFPKRMVDEDEWLDLWTAWMNDEVLQRELFKAKERIRDVDYRTFESDSLLIYEQGLYETRIENGQVDSRRYGNMITIATYHPWLSAIRDLKTIYFLGTLLCIASVYIVSRNILKTYDKQKELDDTRNAFVASMAHDLKTPLAVIKGYSENLMENDDKKKKEDFLNKIINQTDEINGMVSDMLDISKMDSEGFEMERKEIIINEILDSIIRQYKEAAENGQLVFSVNEVEKFELIGDRRYLEKMLSCIIDNAVSYAKENTAIKIDINKNTLSVFNQCDPLSKEKIKHIFELSSGSNGHHGFGLYFAKKVAEAHKLKLSVENITQGVRTVLSIDKY